MASNQPDSLAGAPVCNRLALNTVFMLAWPLSELAQPALPTPLGPFLGSAACKGWWVATGSSWVGCGMEEQGQVALLRGGGVSIGIQGRDGVGQTSH